MGWEDDPVAPSYPATGAPASDPLWKVPADVQTQRDRVRLSMLMDEASTYTDTASQRALAKEIAGTQAKVGKLSWQDDPVTLAAAPSWQDDPVVPQKKEETGFFKDFGNALSHFDINKNFFLRISDTFKERGEIMRAVKDSPAYKQALDNEFNGKPYSAMKWVDDRVDEEYQKRHPTPQLPDAGFSETMTNIGKMAIEHPGTFAGEMTNFVFEDPELLYPRLWRLGLVKAAATLGKAAEIAVGTAEMAARGAAVGGAMSVAQQYQETGKVSPEKTLTDAEVFGASTAVLHAAFRLGFGSREKVGAEIDPVAEAKAVETVQEKIKAGMTPDEALDQVLRASGVSEQNAAEVAQAVKPRLRQMGVAEEVKPKGEADAVDRQGKENQISDAERVRPAEGETGVLREPEQGIDQGNTPQASEVTPAAQAGKIDPRLLATMGLAGIAGAATYALTGERDKAIGAAVAVGALPVAARLMRRLGQSINDVAKVLVDKRFNPTEVFRDMDYGIKGVEYIEMQRQKAGEALLPYGRLQGAERNAAYTRIRDYVQGYRDVELSPNELLAAKNIRENTDTWFGRGQSADVLHSYLENYLPGIYQKKPFAKWSDVIDSLMNEERNLKGQGGLRRSTRHDLEKVIPDYRTVEKLITDGKLDLIPLTNNPFAMARMAANSVNRAIQVKKMVSSLKELKDLSGTPLAVSHSEQLTRQAIEATVGKAGKEFGASKEAIKLWTAFDQQRATRDYVTINHPGLQGLRFHKDLRQPLEFLFDTSNPRSPLNALYGVSMAQKSLLFSMSLFHGSTLGIVAAPMLAGRALAQAVTLMRPHTLKYIANAWEANAGKEISPVVLRMIKAGVTLGKGIQDVDPTFLYRTFNLIKSTVGDVPGIGKWLAGTVDAPIYLHKEVRSLIFDKLNPTFKTAVFMGDEAMWMRKHPDAKPAELDLARRQLGDGVNTLFGGQNWFEWSNNVDQRIARSFMLSMFSPMGRKIQQIAALAPDWNISAVKAWTEGAKAFNPLMAPRASDGLYRTYLVMSGLMYLGAAEALQKHFTGEHIWDKADWTVVDRGDGTFIHLNKHFMEAVHLIHDWRRFMVSKIGYLPSLALETATNKEYVTVPPQPTKKQDAETARIAIEKGKDPEKAVEETHKHELAGPPMQNNPLIHAVKKFFNPIASQSISDPERFMFGNMGMQIYGKSFEKQDEEIRKRAIERGSDPDKAVERIHRMREKKQEIERRP